ASDATLLSHLGRALSAGRSGGDDAPRHGRWAAWDGHSPLLRGRWRVGHPGARMVRTKLAVEPASARDGFRVLVERLWPRGVSRERLAVEAWERNLAPSVELRRYLGRDAARWPEFRRRYRRELLRAERHGALDGLIRRAEAGAVTL